jgi:serine/threonine protein kinase
MFNDETKRWQPMLLKYKLDKLVGKGNFGEVIKARCRTTKKTVAIKLICDAYSSTYNFKKVMREI